MKKLIFLIVLALILGLVLTGCSLLSNVGQVPVTEQSGISYLTKGAPGDPPDVLPLYAGQNIDVGTVSVWNDGINLYVEYNTTGNWVMTETHLSVDDSLAGIPQTKKGNPIPGKFEHSMEHDPAVTEYAYTIPITWEPCTELYIAAHAKVVKITDELVANGGFEVPTTVGSWTVFATGTPGLAWTVEPTIPPWDVGQPQGLELQRISTPNSGDQYAELDAYDPVRIYQDLSTCPEGSCTLTYAWSPRPTVLENIMEVWWNGSKIATHSADGSGGIAWTVEIYTDLVPNASDTTRLEFVEVGTHDQLGMFLDSVSVICIQEESAWAAGSDFPGANWATYFTYTVVKECCDFNAVGDWAMNLYIGTALHERFIIINSHAGGDINGLFGVGYNTTGAPTGTITGEIDGCSIDMLYENYDGIYTADFEGTIAADGNSMSGTWSDYARTDEPWTMTR